MRDGWTEVRIADLVDPVDERLGSRIEPPILTLTERDGFVRQADRYKRRIAAENTSDYRLIHKFDIAYNPYLLWKGAIAQHLSDEDGITSPIYPVFRPCDATDPRFVGLLLASKPMIRLYDSISVGSIERRRRAIPAQFLELTASVPPVADQRRIADLVGAIDRMSSDAQEHRSRALAAREAVVESELSRYQDAPSLALADFADVIGGLTKDQKHEAKDGLVRMPYLRVANVQRGYLDLSDLTTINVDPVRAEKLRLAIGDVLFNEGGDRDKLGRGWVWEGQVPFCIHQNHVLRARIWDSNFDAYFVSIWGNSAFGRRWFELNGAQTTNLASVSLSTLKLFPVPKIPLAEQRRIVQLSEALGNVASSARGVATRAVVLRSAILMDLLSGAHEIPDSYDRFLEAAA